MSSKFSNKMMLVFTSVLLLVSNIPFWSTCTQAENDFSTIQNEYTLALLEDLPISLDDLFSLDNYTKFEAILDRIEIGTSFWPIKPYGTFFGHGHAEGLPRMDFNPHEKDVEIRAPASSHFESYGTQNGSIVEIKGYECVLDCSLNLDLGNECWILFDHIHLLKTIWDEMESTGNISLSKGDLLGFTYTVYESSIVDFSYFYRGIQIPPHYAFTPKLLGKVEVLYNFLFERAKLNGLYPRAYMINDMNIHKDDEFWGAWYYKTGPYDSYIDPEVHISHYDFGVLSLINREFTSTETYWKDPIDPAKNLTDDVLGVGRNAGSAVTPGYKAIGEEGKILLVEGDNTTGIMEFRTMGASDFGPKNTSIYGRFNVLVNSTSIIEDELQIEFFPTLGEAQSGFTANVSTYYRNYHPSIDEIELPPPPETSSPSPGTQEGVLFVYPAIFSTLIICVIVRKRKN